jgi:O-antigen/teichoic acid export membrane protein
MATSLFTAVLTLYLVRALSPDGYGVYALAFTISGLLFLPSDFGISASAARFIAERRGDQSAVARVIADALRLKVIVSSLVTLALFGLAEPIASAYDQPDLVWPLRAASLALFGQGVVFFVSSAFYAQGQVAANLRLVFSESAVEVGAAVALVALGAGAAGAAFGHAIGYLFGAALGVRMIVARLGRRAVSVRTPRAERRTRELALYAGALAIVDGAYTLFTAIDSLIIAGVLSTAAVGLFSAPMRLTTFLHYPGHAISSAVAPRIARHTSHPPDVRTFTAALRYLVIIQAPITVAVTVWATPIVLLLLGSAYEESADVLRALGPYVFLAGFGPIVSVGANYLGQARRRIPIAISAVLINLVLDLVLIPRIGIVGGAIGTDVAYAVYAPAHLWVCKRMLGFSLRPLLVVLARTTLAAAAMGGVLAAVGTADLSLTDWLMGGIGGILAFLTVLVVSRELSRAELGVARAAVSRMRPRGARAV